MRTLTTTWLVCFFSVLWFSTAGSAQAQNFIDDFEDGSVSDGIPVTWTTSPANASGTFSTIDAGDLKLIDSSYALLMVDGLDMENVSIRTQVRIEVGDWIGVFARYTPFQQPVDSYYAGLGADGIAFAGLTSPSAVYDLVEEPTSLDVRGHDVVFQFDVIGNEASIWAWYPEDPMPAEPIGSFQSDYLQHGGVAVWVGRDGRIIRARGAFRYVQVADSHISEPAIQLSAAIPEPSTNILFVIGALIVFMIASRRRRMRLSLDILRFGTPQIASLMNPCRPLARTFLTISIGMIFTRPTAAQSLSFVYEDEYGNIMPYRLFLPPDHNPTQEYPLVLALHGAGSRGTDNVKQLGFAENLITATRQPEYASFLVAPQAPIADSWLSIRSVDLLEGIVNYVQQQYLVDDERLYVTGYSMGGYGTIGQLYYLPGKFAAGVPIASGTPPADADPVAEVIHDMPIWVFHGAQDTVVPVDYSRLLIDTLMDYGASPLYTEYPSMGHSIPHTVYAEEELYPWMFAQHLAPEPSPPGNFDNDHDVDGADFLVWQRGELPNPLSLSNLADWQVNFGAVSSPITAASTVVPEPSSLMLMLVAYTCGLGWRRLT